MEDYYADVHLRELVSTAMHTRGGNITAHTINIKLVQVRSEGSVF